MDRLKRWRGYLIAFLIGSFAIPAAAQLMKLDDGTVASKVVVYGSDGAIGGASADPAEVDALNRSLVVGGVGVDESITGTNPVAVGGRASTAVPTAMSADNDSQFVWLSLNGSVHTMSTAGTSTLTNTSDAASSTALLAANTSRLHAKCLNDSSSVLYINYGATASTTAFTEKVEAGGTWFMEVPIYTGAINGIWSADASGAARCTELTQ